MAEAKHADEFKQDSDDVSLLIGPQIKQSLQKHSRNSNQN